MHDKDARQGHTTKTISRDDRPILGLGGKASSIGSLDLRRTQNESESELTQDPSDEISVKHAGGIPQRADIMSNFLQQEQCFIQTVQA
jgi:hypothetical protein